MDTTTFSVTPSIKWTHKNWQYLIKIKEFWTYDEYMQLPEWTVLGKRYELHDGQLKEIKMPNTKHQRTSKRLQRILMEQVEDTGLGEIFNAPYRVSFPQHHRSYEPDLIYVSNERREIIKKDDIQGAPDLLIEILSPTTRKNDTIDKKEIYQWANVPEYWIVDPEAETIEVLTLQDSVYKRHGLFTKNDTLTSLVLPNLRISVEQIFSE